MRPEDSERYRAIREAAARAREEARAMRERCEERRRRSAATRMEQAEDAGLVTVPDRAGIGGRA
jgi:hypothetical protein